mmetsp:Transcript_590/g.2000  ORF Transcript_590/g.2000 Transcript_590/m.2000 type:complete len:257 (+) Transcript_590:1075-1845(+)
MHHLPNDALRPLGVPHSDDLFLHILLQQCPQLVALGFQVLDPFSATLVAHADEENEVLRGLSVEDNIVRTLGQHRRLHAKCSSRSRRTRGVDVLEQHHVQGEVPPACIAQALDNSPGSVVITLHGNHEEHLHYLGGAEIVQVQRVCGWPGDRHAVPRPNHEPLALLGHCKQVRQAQCSRGCASIAGRCGRRHHLEGRKGAHGILSGLRRLWRQQVRRVRDAAAEQPARRAGALAALGWRMRHHRFTGAQVEAEVRR